MQRFFTVDEYNIVGIVITLVLGIIIFILFPISNHRLGDLFSRLTSILTHSTRVASLKRKLALPNNFKGVNTEIAQQAEEFNSETSVKLGTGNLCMIIREYLNTYNPLFYMPFSTANERKYSMLHPFGYFKWIIILLGIFTGWFTTTVTVYIVQAVYPNNTFSNDITVIVIIGVLASILCQPIIFLIIYGFYTLYLYMLKKSFKVNDTRVKSEYAPTLVKSRNTSQCVSMVVDNQHSLNSTARKGFLDAAKSDTGRISIGEGGDNASPAKVNISPGTGPSTSAGDFLNALLIENLQEYYDEDKRNDSGLLDKFTVVSFVCVIAMGCFSGFTCFAISSAIAKALFIAFCFEILFDHLAVRNLVCLIIAAFASCYRRCYPNRTIPTEPTQMNFITKREHTNTQNVQVTEISKLMISPMQKSLSQTQNIPLVIPNDDSSNLQPSPVVLDKSGDIEKPDDEDRKWTELTYLAKTFQDFDRILLRKIYITYDAVTSDSLVKNWRDTAITAELYDKNPEGEVWNEAQELADLEGVRLRDASHSFNIIPKDSVNDFGQIPEDSKEDHYNEENKRENMSFTEPPNVGGSELSKKQAKSQGAVFKNMGIKGQINPKLHQEHNVGNDLLIDNIEEYPQPPELEFRSPKGQINEKGSNPYGFQSDDKVYPMGPAKNVPDKGPVAFKETAMVPKGDIAGLPHLTPASSEANIPTYKEDLSVRNSLEKSGGIQIPGDSQIGAYLKSKVPATIPEENIKEIEKTNEKPTEKSNMPAQKGWLGLGIKPKKSLDTGINSQIAAETGILPIAKNSPKHIVNPTEKMLDSNENSPSPIKLDSPNKIDSPMKMESPIMSPDMRNSPPASSAPPAENTENPQIEKSGLNPIKTEKSTAKFAENTQKQTEIQNILKNEEMLSSGKYGSSVNPLKSDIDINPAKYASEVGPPIYKGSVYPSTKEEKVTSEKINENKAKIGKMDENNAESEKIIENNEKSGKLNENNSKSEKMNENNAESGKIEVLEQSVNGEKPLFEIDTVVKKQNEDSSKEDTKKQYSSEGQGTKKGNKKSHKKDSKESKKSNKNTENSAKNAEKSSKIDEKVSKNDEKLVQNSEHSDKNTEKLPQNAEKQSQNIEKYPQTVENHTKTYEKSPKNDILEAKNKVKTSDQKSVKSSKSPDQNSGKPSSSKETHKISKNPHDTAKNESPVNFAEDQKDAKNSNHANTKNNSHGKHNGHIMESGQTSEIEVVYAGTEGHAPLTNEDASPVVAFGGQDTNNDAKETIVKIEKTENSKSNSQKLAPIAKLAPNAGLKNKHTPGKLQEKTGSEIGGSTNIGPNTNLEKIEETKNPKNEQTYHSGPNVHEKHNPKYEDLEETQKISDKGGVAGIKPEILASVTRNKPLLISSDAQTDMHNTPNKRKNINEKLTAASGLNAMQIESPPKKLQYANNNQIDWSEKKKALREQVFDLAEILDQKIAEVSKKRAKRKLKDQLVKKYDNSARKKSPEKIFEEVQNEPLSAQRDFATLNENEDDRHSDSGIIDDNQVEFKGNRNFSEGENFEQGIEDNEDIIYYHKDDLTNYSKNQGLNRMQARVIKRNEGEPVLSDSDIFEAITKSMAQPYNPTRIYESDQEDPQRLGEIAEAIGFEGEVDRTKKSPHKIKRKSPQTKKMTQTARQFGLGAIKRSVSQELTGRKHIPLKRKPKIPFMLAPIPKRLPKLPQQKPTDSPYSELLYKRYKEYQPNEQQVFFIGLSMKYRIN